jgi:hypothetical protein
MTRAIHPAWLAVAAAVGMASTLATWAASGATTSNTEIPVGLSSSHVALRYEQDYPTIPYNGPARANAVARLQSRLDSGEVHLKWKAPRGYLDSLLEALHIDPSSQTLVYSKTSLQIEAINAATPRAIYFNDDTYVAWVQGDRMLELVTMDANLGAVFYTLPNHETSQVKLEREASRCLTCHDTFSMLGGGVPQFRFTSTLVNRNGEVVTGEPGQETTDATPVAERWGGWFVTGRSSGQNRLGNILVNTGKEFEAQKAKPLPDVDTLDHLLDVKPYITNTSDVVALLVLEHQSYIHNLITRANLKSRSLLTKLEKGSDVDTLTWDQLSPKSQGAMHRLLEPMVRALLFVDAAKLTGDMVSTSGFDKWFQSQPPRDRAGRSLRQLDLHTRVFAHRLSYMIYSPGFDGMPGVAKDYVYARLAEILSGRDQDPVFADLAADERATLQQILAETKPDYSRSAGASRVASVAATSRPLP